MKELLSLNHHFFKYRGRILLGIFFLTTANFALVSIPVLIRFAIDEVGNLLEHVSGKEFSSYSEVLFSKQIGFELAYFALLLVLAIIVYGVLLFLTRQTIIVASRLIEYDIRNEVYQHMQALPMSYFAQTKSGDTYIRLTDDVNRVREYFGPAFMYMINTITRAGIIITIMYQVNSNLTLWALIPMPFMSVMAYFLSGYINRLSKEIQEQYAHVAGRANETFSSIRLIKSYLREDYQKQLFEEEADTYRRKKMTLSAVEAMFFPMLNLLIGLSVILVVWQSGLGIQDGTTTVGNIAEFIIYVAYLTWPVASLGYTINLIQRSAASNKRIQDFLSIPTIDVSQGKVDKSSVLDINKGKIEFKNVSFTYPNSEYKALDNISLEIRPGEKVGIVGKTGSGKTTLIQMIPRLFDATEGVVKINGFDVQDLSLNNLRDGIAYVPQENFLFSDTLKSNIAFSVQEATMQDVEDAAEKAQILENILEFDKKFDTILGERGITLSGGQKQRTSIARALLKKSKIILLDDSLSAVDAKTEDKILHYINNELNNATVVLVSHRISTIKNCEKIIVLENGKIHEMGNHQQLIEQKGIYFRLYTKQLLEQEISTY